MFFMGKPLQGDAAIIITTAGRDQLDTDLGV
jgi:hypothetical protein